MKKSLLWAAVLFGIASVTLPAFAAKGPAKQLQQQYKQQKTQLRKDLRSQQKTLKQDFKASASALKKNKNPLTGVQLTAITGTTLTVTKDGKTYTVTTDANTKLRRHFGGQATLSEFSVGDKLNVRGTFTDTTQTTMLARQVKDLSIMKRRGTFIGDVVSVSGATFVLNAVHRGNQTVTTDAGTKFIGRNQTPITLQSITVGHRVRVKGVWNKISKTITEVKEVKDFALPVTTASTSPTPTP